MGVMLMISITVVLAAVIASFVFSMSFSKDTPRVVAVTASRQSPDTICIKNMGGYDTDFLKDDMSFRVLVNGIDCTYNDATGRCPEECTVNPSGNDAEWSLKKHTGSMITISGSDIRNDKVRVIVMGSFQDESERILLDTMV
jgi:FlaG/FlaF family flagellin (archaellin)